MGAPEIHLEIGPSWFTALCEEYKDNCFTSYFAKVRDLFAAKSTAGTFAGTSMSMRGNDVLYCKNVVGIVVEEGARKQIAQVLLRDQDNQATYTIYAEANKICESLSINNANTTMCTTEPFDAPLLSAKCNIPFLKDAPILMPSDVPSSPYLVIPRIAAISLTAFATIKALQNARANNKQWAIIWTSVAVGAGAIAAKI